MSRVELCTNYRISRKIAHPGKEYCRRAPVLRSVSAPTTAGPIEWIRESPAELRAEMERLARTATLEPGALFFREGEPCTHFAIVEAGNLRVFKTDPAGRELTLYHVRDGEACVVNLLCAALGGPAMATARAEVDTLATIFPASMLEAWMAASAPVRRFVLEAFAARFVEVLSLAEEIAFHRIGSRLASLLLERFARDPVVAATHEEIAAELGTAREVVSRALGELARRGAIQASRGRIVLIDEDSLRQVK